MRQRALILLLTEKRTQPALLQEMHDLDDRYDTSVAAIRPLGVIPTAQPRRVDRGGRGLPRVP